MNGPDNLLDAPLPSAPLADVINHTRLPSQYFQMIDVDDTVFHVVVVRSTYDMYRADAQGHLLLADEQTDLVETDEYYGEINLSSVVQESDYAPFKPRCDILFAHASAHAPDGKPAERIAVGVRIGDWEKSLQATGPRRLEAGALGWRLTDPQPVVQVPLRYEHAWGGTCQWPLQLADDQEPEFLDRDENNPIGCGFLSNRWARKTGASRFVAPQLEVLGEAFEARDADAQKYPVVGLGPIGRWWLPRRLKAGTYDEQWKQTRWPALPKDFDFAYWNAAPEDQQIDYPAGGEQVVMIGLHPGGEMRFRLPKPDARLLLHLSAGVPMFKSLNVDTLLFDLEAMQLVVVQRALVAAQAGVDTIEIGTWDVEGARARNAALLAQRSATRNP
jgi:hypothetical protein